MRSKPSKTSRVNLLGAKLRSRKLSAIEAHPRIVVRSYTYRFGGLLGRQEFGR